MPAATDDVGLVLAAGVRKPPKEETAGEGLERYRLRYRDLSAAGEAVACARGGRGERRATLAVTIARKTVEVGWADFLQVWLVCLSLWASSIGAGRRPAQRAGECADARR
jgi:hypothetical protein